ncbi:hypothetical protein [Kutzneria buriramensis]|uniref:hypothetical protein n=1 Tax=Kutzneria buriramensis TaxID=1045776 RepID=UPI000E21E01E|nr:hypothetical protein [Kutzneria buriramensis]
MGQQQHRQGDVDGETAGRRALLQPEAPSAARAPVRHEIDEDAADGTALLIRSVLCSTPRMAMSLNSADLDPR